MSCVCNNSTGFARFDRKPVIEACQQTMANIEKTWKDDKRTWIKSWLRWRKHVWWHLTRHLGFSPPSRSRAEHAYQKDGMLPAQFMVEFQGAEQHHLCEKILQMAQQSSGSKVLVSDYAVHRINL